jgi:hypothetical protein
MRRPTGRHGGRGGDTRPGPGTTGHPATGTAAVPTASTATPTHAPAMTAEAVVALANEVCDFHARAEVARALAGHSASHAEHANLTADAAHWDALVRERWSALVEAIEVVLPGAALPEEFMPVRPLSNGHVELQAHDTAGCRVVVLLSGAQALAVGAHLTAYAAISLDRIGQKLDGGLPHLGAAPPLTANNDAEARP